MIQIKKFKLKGKSLAAAITAAILALLIIAYAVISAILPNLPNNTPTPELPELVEDIRAVCRLNPNTCYVCMDVPQAAKAADFVPCIITSYDYTVNAIRAVCDVLKG